MAENTLSRILVQNQLIDRNSLTNVLKQQEQFLKQSDWKLLGEILVESGEISYKDLWAALDRQAQLFDIELFALRPHPCQPMVLAVCLGAPKQEKWIYRYRDKLPSVNIFLAIGATINFEAGRKQRAPQWISNLGFEWLHRLTHEPGRLWKQYTIDDIPFLGSLLKQNLGLYSPPFIIQEQLEYLLPSALEK